MNPKVPRLPAVDCDWHQRTRDWWRHVWESPMAGEYLETDIDGLGRLAILIDQFYTSHNPNLMSEIRLQEARFGLSPVDRSRLQWEVHRREESERRRKPPAAPKHATGGEDPRDVLRVVS